MRISDWSSDVCSSDLLKIADRPCQLGFQRMLITRGFDKLAGAETLILLHRLEALARAMRQTLRREFQTSIVKLRLRHRHRAAVEQIGRASCRERVCQYL